MSALWLSNLTAWALQVLILVMAGGLLAWTFRLRDPRCRLLCWHVLLAACLLLPALQRWDVPRRAAAPSVSVKAVATGAPPLSNLTSLPDWPRWIAAVLLAGIAARAAWLALGFWRLRRYRRNSRVISPWPEWLEDAAGRVGVRPEVCISDEVLGPVTFGLRRPAILLPARFLHLEPGAQIAIACHELLHVRRRDWALTVIEEAIRAVLWFHPAIWWLLAQIQLAREQLVDRQVVLLTRDRDEYLRALLAFAVQRQAELAPASLFLRKHHLTRRAASLFDEVSMSKRRLAFSLAAVFGLMIFAGRFAAWSFPLQAPARVEQYVSIDSDRSISVDTGGAALLHRAPVEYPREARQKRIQGAVILELALDRTGQVSDARVVSGPDELRRAALQSVLQWHYSMDPPLPAKMQVTINFQLPESSLANPPEPKSASRIGPPAVGENNLLRRIEIKGLSDATRDKIMRVMPVQVGQPLTADAQARIQEALAQVDEHLVVSYLQGSEGTVLLVMLRGQGFASAAPRSALPPPGPPEGAGGNAEARPRSPQRIRVGSSVQRLVLLEAPSPRYPALARQARVQGTVRLSVTIGRDGKVTRIEALSGHPLLVPSAMETVKNWLYKPTYLNGEPVDVITEVSIPFTLE